MRSLRNVSFSHDLEATLKAMGFDGAQARYHRRAAQVRAMWADIVDEAFLPHTNAVFIKQEEDGRKLLIAYVDESMFAAELNARRELIKLQFLQRYGEDIDEFRILISRGKYKKRRPFVSEAEAEGSERARPLPLEDGQRAALEKALAGVEDPSLRAVLEKAATADMGWRNGLKVKKDSKNND